MTVFVPTVGAPRKAEEIKQLVPPWMETRFPSLLGAVLHAMGVADQQVTVGDFTVLIRGPNAPGTVRYVAKVSDPIIRVWHKNPNAALAPLTITVSNGDILVSLGTDGGSAISTNAADLKAAIEAHPVASTLVDVALYDTDALLADTVVGTTKDYVTSQPDGLEGARRDIFLDYATGGDLVVLGNNYGVARPALVSLTDDQFRRYIAALAVRKKGNRQSIEALLSVLFGDKSTAGWAVYEDFRRKTITIELVAVLNPTGPSTATYLRSPLATPSTAQHTGDYLRPSAASVFFPAVKPTSASPVSPIYNNSPYISITGLNFAAYLAIMELVRAAGVQVEFVLKGQ